MTTKLAELLRRIAEKRTDKFTTDGPDPSIVWIACSGLSGVFIGRLDEIDNFTLDYMDAIASAVGMEFDVVRLAEPPIRWRYALFNPSSVDDSHLERLDNVNYSDKRSASIAALCAILTYKLGEGE